MRALIAGLAVLLVSNLVIPAQEPDEPLEKLLVSADVHIRRAALARAEKMEKIPADLAKPLVGFIQEELKRALFPPPRREKPGAFEPLKSIPFVGDETSLTRIKAEPQKYLGGEFVLCGGLSIGDYYNFGYRDTAESYYSFRYREVGKDAKPTGQSASLYLPRTEGASLAEMVTRTIEGGAAGRVVRLKCTIRRERCPDIAYATSSVEITDWQMMDRTKEAWEPWAFDGIGLGFGLLARTGKAGIDELVEIVAAESNTRNEFGDSLMRVYATGELAEAREATRQLAANMLRDRLESAKGERTIGSIREAMAKLPPPEKTKAELAAERAAEEEEMAALRSAAAKRQADAAKKLAERVKTLLNLGKNLEKANPTAAARYYNDVINLSPKSPEAVAARDRLKAISNKK